MVAAFKSEIIAAPNKGYRLEAKEPREMLLQFSDESTSQVGMVQSVSQQNYIVGRFIVACLDDDSVTQMNLSEAMHVGISTIKKYLAETRQKLAEWNLTLEQYKTEACESSVKKEISAALSSIIFKRWENPPR